MQGRASALEVGGRYGNLTILRTEGDDLRGTRDRAPRVLVRCACGTERAMVRWAIAAGKTTSCGCQRIKRFLRRRRSFLRDLDAGYLQNARAT